MKNEQRMGQNAAGITICLLLLLSLAGCGGGGGSSQVTVSGAVEYEDKEYGTTGFTGKTYYKAVRFAEVQAVNAASGLTIATGTTDASGLYTLTLPSSSTIYIRVISSASSPLSATIPLVSVKSISSVLYAVAGSTFTALGTAMANISIPVTSPAAGAFNILDVFTSGAEFVQSLSGGSYPPAVAAFGQTENAKGTYYCTGSDLNYCVGGEGVYVLNYGGDTDEYDDDVLWHEYAHFIAAKYSKDDSQGGVHYLTSNDLDLRLTWSEGWGSFFPGAVKTWLAPALLSTVPAMATTVYVDTSGGSGWSFDFGNPGGSLYIYASNEAAVAKVLIGLRSIHGMQAVWDVFTSSYVKTATVAAPVVNLEVFWDAWNLLGKPDITAILSERLIRYSADTYEPGDDTANAARLAGVNGSAENHTLYGSADVDYIAFAATAGPQYTVRTRLLKNGADTVIRIIAPDQITPVANASNDNTNGAIYTGTAVPCTPLTNECHENGYDILGSTKSFTVTAPGTYYVEVKSSPNRPLSAGRYGEYSLTITSP